MVLAASFIVFIYIHTGIHTRERIAAEVPLFPLLGNLSPSSRAVPPAVPTTVTDPGIGTVCIEEGLSASTPFFPKTSTSLLGDGAAALHTLRFVPLFLLFLLKIICKLVR